jgi:hypothetical protein
LLRVSGPEGRIAFWTLFVPRSIPASMAGHLFPVFPAGETFPAYRTWTLFENFQAWKIL